MTKALALIRAAKKSGADAVKFQKRDIKSLYQGDILKNPKKHEHGFQYALEVQRRVEFWVKDYQQIFRLCHKLGLVCLATPFDEKSVDFLEKFNPPLYKVASADLINFPLLEKIIQTKKPIIFSTGMSTSEELDKTVSFLKSRAVDFSLLHCHSTYPANSDDLNLRLIPYYQNKYGVKIGYSGHERGFDPTLAAVALGASIVERHITYDKNAPGPDHPASLEPEEFGEMVQKIRSLEKTLGRPEKLLSQGEAINRQVLGKTMVAAGLITKGQIINKADLAVKITFEKGLSPQEFYSVVGAIAKRDIKKDEILTVADLGKKLSQESTPIFKSNWGYKVSFLDLDQRLRKGMKLVEFHLTESDLNSKIDSGKKYDLELYLHVPVYGKGELIVDLCSFDDKAWKESIRITQDSINLGRRLAKHFRGRPKIVMHVGGMTLEPTSKELWPKMLKRAEQALKLLDIEGVDFLPENLTALAWHKGGQWYQNVFNKPGEISAFCRKFGLKMCFDTSHAWVAACYYGFDYYDFVKECAPYIAHLHIVDGKAPNGEGLQIGEGEVDFKKVFDLIYKYAKKPKMISWLPEIWMGHLENCQGFDLALTKLVKFKHKLLGQFYD